MFVTYSRYEQMSIVMNKAPELYIFFRKGVKVVGASLSDRRMGPIRARIARRASPRYGTLSLAASRLQARGGVLRPWPLTTLPCTPALASGRDRR